MHPFGIRENLLRDVRVDPEESSRSRSSSSYSFVKQSRLDKFRGIKVRRLKGKRRRKLIRQ